MHRRMVGRAFVCACLCASLSGLGLCPLPLPELKQWVHAAGSSRSRVVVSISFDPYK